MVDVNNLKINSKVSVKVDASGTTRQGVVKDISADDANNVKVTVEYSEPTKIVAAPADITLV